MTFQQKLNEMNNFKILKQLPTQNSISARNKSFVLELICLQKTDMKEHLSGRKKEKEVKNLSQNRKNAGRNGVPIKINK